MKRVALRVLAAATVGYLAGLGVVFAVLVFGPDITDGVTDFGL